MKAELLYFFVKTIYLYIDSAVALCKDRGMLLLSLFDKNSMKSIFLQKKVTFNSIEKRQCGNYGNLLSTFFGRNFVKLTLLLKILLNK